MLLVAMTKGITCACARTPWRPLTLPMGGAAPRPIGLRQRGRGSSEVSSPEGPCSHRGRGPAGRLDTRALTTRALICPPAGQAGGNSDYERLVTYSKRSSSATRTNRPEPRESNTATSNPVKVPPFDEVRYSPFLQQ